MFCKVCALDCHAILTEVLIEINESFNRVRSFGLSDFIPGYQYRPTMRLVNSSPRRVYSDSSMINAKLLCMFFDARSLTYILCTIFSAAMGLWSW
jgi:hypothetical protein